MFEGVSSQLDVTLYVELFENPGTVRADGLDANREESGYFRW